MNVSKRMKQGYRIISTVLIIAICFNTLFGTKTVAYASESAPDVETNAIHPSSNLKVTEGVIYEAAPESGKVWGNTPLIESTQTKTMAAPLSTPSGVVKPSDKANDSSSHDGMYADTGSNKGPGHYETKDVWVIDRIETLTKTIPAVYETKIGYLPARTETRYEIIPEWFEKVVIPKQVEHKKVWVPEKVTYVPKIIPAKTGYRTVVVKPAHMIYGTKTVPGYWVNGKKYIPPKTIRTKVKKGRGYRYITRTIPGKWVPTRRWVGPRQVPNNTWVPAQTRREKYVIEPAKKTMEKVVLKKGYFREYDVTVKEAETKYIHHDEVKRPYQVQIPPEEVEIKVLVKEAYQVTEKREIGHFEPRQVWVADPLNVNTSSTTNTSGDDSSIKPSDDKGENIDENEGAEIPAEEEEKTLLQRIAEKGRDKLDSVVDSVGQSVKNIQKITDTIEQEISSEIKGKVEGTKEAINLAFKNAEESIREIYELDQELRKQSKEWISGAFESAKETVTNALNSRVGKGVLGGLQFVGGVAQLGVAAGLCAIGLPVLGVVVAAHGAADITQGLATTVNSIAGEEKLAEINPIEEIYRGIGGAVGNAIGGEEGKAKGEAIASIAFTGIDTVIGLVSVQGAAKLLGKVDDVVDLATDMSKIARSNKLLEAADTAEDTLDGVTDLNKAADTIEDAGDALSDANKLDEAIDSTGDVVSDAVDTTTDATSDALKTTDKIEDVSEGSSVITEQAEEADKILNKLLEDLDDIVIGGERKSRVKLNLQFFGNSSVDKVDDIVDAVDDTVDVVDEIADTVDTVEDAIDTTSDVADVTEDVANASENVVNSGNEVVETGYVKSSEIFDSIDEGLNFTTTTTKRMENPDRYVPVEFLQDTIKNGTGVPDPAGTSNALMYYSQMTRNGKMYNLEVLYDEATNTVFHFEYTRRSLGPFAQIPKP